jgi:hypothetical protein
MTSTYLHTSIYVFANTVVCMHLQRAEYEEHTLREQRKAAQSVLRSRMSKTKTQLQQQVAELKDKTYAEADTIGHAEGPGDDNDRNKTLMRVMYAEADSEELVDNQKQGGEDEYEPDAKKSRLQLQQEEEEREREGEGEGVDNDEESEYAGLPTLHMRPSANLWGRQDQGEPHDDDVDVDDEEGDGGTRHIRFAATGLSADEVVNSGSAGRGWGKGRMCSEDLQNGMMKLKFFACWYVSNGICVKAHACTCIVHVHVYSPFTCLCILYACAYTHTMTCYLWEHIMHVVDFSDEPACVCSKLLM